MLAHRRGPAIRLARENTAIEVVPEESNECVSQTHSFVEQAVQAVHAVQAERKVRTLKFSVEELHDVTLPPNHPLLVWSVEYASQITNRMHRHTGVGRPAFELRRGKPTRRALPSFGEKVTAMVLGTKKMKNEGAQKVSTVKSLSEAQRKDGDMVMAVCGLPGSKA